jgi:hypothetical protein
VTFVVVQRSGPVYHAEGTVLLFPPEITIERNDAANVEGNPYLYLSGLTDARDVLVRAITARSARDEVVAQAPDSEYDVTPDFDSSGPIILVRVDAATPDGAVAGLTEILGRVPPTLVELQTGLGIDRSAFITSRVVTEDSRPTVVRKGQIRAGIATAAALLAVSVLLIGLLDGLLAGRRRGRAESTSAGSPVAESAAAESGLPEGVGVAEPLGRDESRPGRGAARPRPRKRKPRRPESVDDDVPASR